MELKKQETINETSTTKQQNIKNYEKNRQINKQSIRNQ